MELGFDSRRRVRCLARIRIYMCPAPWCHERRRAGEARRLNLRLGGRKPIGQKSRLSIESGPLGLLEGGCLPDGGVATARFEWVSVRLNGPFSTNEPIVRIRGFSRCLTNEVNSIATNSQAATDDPGHRSAPSPESGGLWLEGVAAVVNSDGVVEEISAGFVDWLRVPRDKILGTNLIAAIGTIEPRWPDLIRPVWDSPDVFASLTLSGGASAQNWFRLELFRAGTGRVVRLESIFPPHGELAEQGFRNLDRGGAEARTMYLRLMRSESQIEALMNRWPGVIFSQRADFSFRFVSSRIEDLTGVAADEWNRKPNRFWELVHEADLDELRRQLKRAPESVDGIATTFRIRHAGTGRVSYIMEHRQAATTRNGLVLGYEGVWLDVTRQTIAEKRLSSAAWKETLAVLTMGLAHDFSNVMAGIHSLSESFLDEVGTDHPFAEGLALIRKNSMQASQLVHRIINLHHGKIGERNYHDLNQVLNELEDLIRKIIPRRIEVEVIPAPEPLPLFVDDFEFRQVIINLALNAAEAMEENGRLTLSATVRETFPDNVVKQGIWPRVPAARLSVKDTGRGIRVQRLAAIFDPFFTTKPMNKGSGLGLYNARLFADKHRGAITVESQVGEGTEFAVWLPVSDFTEAERHETEAASRRRCLLVAGATPLLTERTAELLRVNGYHVVTAGSWEQAQDVLEGNEYVLSGVFLLAEAESPELKRLLRQALRKRPRIATVLQSVGRHHDEWTAELADDVDLVVGSEMKHESILNRLKSVLNEHDHGSV